MRSFLIKTAICFLLTWVGGKAFAQDDQHTIDSLKSVATNEKNHDTVRLYAYAFLIDRFAVDADAVIYYSAQIGKIAKVGIKKSKKGTPLYKAYASYMALYYNNLAGFTDLDDPKGFEYLEKAMKYFKETQYKSEYYYAMINKGTRYGRMNQFKKAQDCNFKALYYFEIVEKEDRFGTALAYINIASLYEWQNDFKTSIFYLKRALRYLEKDTTGSMDILIHKSTCLMNIGSNYVDIKNYSKAREYYFRALYLAKQYDIDLYMSFNYSKIGITYEEEKKLDVAFDYYKKAYEKANDERSIVYAAVNLGAIYLWKKDYRKALEYGNEGLKYAGNTDKYIKESNYNLLYKAHKGLGQYKQAMEYLEKEKALKDSINSTDNTRALKSQKEEYAYEKKAIQLKLDSERKNAEKNKVLYGLSIVLLVLLFAGFILYVLYKHRQRTITYEKNELNQRLLRSQMNPHFLFNSLNAVYNYMDKNQPEEAGRYLTSFAKLVRSILDNSREESVMLSKELSWLENYLKLQQLRFEKPFQYTINVEPEVEPELTLVPPMLVQPFVENAIEHGFAISRESNMLNISYRKNGEMLEITVSDTGSGFQKKDPENKQHQSLALSITEERLRLLTIKYKKKANFRIESEPEKGTRIFFSVPFQTLA
ncbi:histidine kinase [Fluviicola sp.]|uniref:tetratricopeptide repeat-containing sensor histidine kinase n=1 Tax=Fluviicola sp. TaxID=1917219 RepID=UPI0031D20945